ncbi:hypothetical protein H0H87_009078, partial [Tephrocybe sp. NHM501043]
MPSPPHNADMPGKPPSPQPALASASSVAPGMLGLYSDGAYRPHSARHQHDDLRHTSPRTARRQAHAPYPARRSHTPVTPSEEDIGSSDSSSNSSDYSSVVHSSDELDEDEDKPLVDGRGDSATGSASGKQGGFTFSAATWSFANPNPNAAPPPRPHHAQNPYPSDRPECRPRSHYDHPPRYYTQPPLHP